MRLLLFFIFFLISSACFSQILQGRWKGSFTTINDGIETGYYSPIKLEFIISGDTSYSVFSQSLGHIDKYKGGYFTYTVYYEQLSQDSIYLSELEIIEPKNAHLTCLKNMYLKIIDKKNSIFLEGVWEYNSDKCKNYGKIFLRKTKR